MRAVPPQTGGRVLPVGEVEGRPMVSAASGGARGRIPSPMTDLAIGEGSRCLLPVEILVRDFGPNFFAAGYQPCIPAPLPGICLTPFRHGRLE